MKDKPAIEAPQNYSNNSDKKGYWWGLTVGVEGRQGRGEQWGKIGTTVIEQEEKSIGIYELLPTIYS